MWMCKHVFVIVHTMQWFKLYFTWQSAILVLSIADYFLEVLMGRFLNPDNGAFSEAVNSEIYIDKTRLLEYTNQVINTTSKFICNSRPRRFGKSMTADMLSAYYSRGCVSKELFKNYEISTVSSYEKNLNKYDVIHFDVQWCICLLYTSPSPRD